MIHTRRMPIKRLFSLLLAMIMWMGVFGCIPASAGTVYARKSIRMYEEMDEDSSVLCRIPKGTQLYTPGGRPWCEVTYNGMTGYVKRNMISKTPVKPSDTREETGEAEEIEVTLKPAKGLVLLDKTQRLAKDWSGAVVLGEGGMAIPQLYQKDYRGKVCVFKGEEKRVSTSGCAAVCLSMIIAYKTGNYRQSPYTLFRDACQQGFYRGNGLGSRAIETLARNYGLVGQWKKLDEQGIIQALKEEKPIIVHVDKGQFSEGGHYLVLRGLNEEDQVLINDPSNKKRSAKAFPAQTFVDESKGSLPFFVCEGIDEQVVEEVLAAQKEKEAGKAAQEEGDKPEGTPAPQEIETTPAPEEE